MITKTALVGLAHFLMQADPITVQNVIEQLPAQESEQVIQYIETEEARKSKLPEAFINKISTTGNVIPGGPSRETSADH